MFHAGRVAVVRRNNAFERLFDLPERVLPASALTAAPVDRAESHVALVRRAAQALGVATTPSLADYFRTNLAQTRQAVDLLAAAGELVPVVLPSGEAWLWHEARTPRRIETTALISPFDSLAFDRRRLAQVFGVDYTIGLYTPAAQRTHGYYVYLFVLDDAITARTDLKADRQAGVLRVQSAWLEATSVPQRNQVAGALADELTRLAGWLGLSDIAVAGRGDLSADLVAALG